MKKYKRVGICSGYLIHSFAQIPELFYSLRMGGLYEARVCSTVHTCNMTEDITLQIEIK